MASPTHAASGGSVSALAGPCHRMEQIRSPGPLSGLTERMSQGDVPFAAKPRTTIEPFDGSL